MTTFITRPKSSIVVFILLFLIYLRNKSRSDKYKKIIYSIFNITLSLSHDKEFVFNQLIKHSNRIHVDKFEQINNVEIHSMVSEKIVFYYILCVKSFLYFSKLNVPIIIHDDGTLKKKHFNLLKKHLPLVSIIPFFVASKKINSRLKKWKTVMYYRNNNINVYNMIDLVDIPILSEKERIIYLDGDILFFNDPKEITEWIKMNENEVLYMKDVTDSHVLSKNEYNILLGKKYLLKFNMGIFCYHKKKYSLSNIEKYFKKLEKTNKPNGRWRDQTYWMYFSTTQYSDRKQLPDSYKVQVNPKITPDTVCIHYISPIRHLIIDHGLKLLYEVGLF